MFESKPFAVYVLPLTGVPVVPCPAPDATTSTPKLVAVGCVQFITALSVPTMGVTAVTGTQAEIALTLSTNHLSPAVPEVPV